MSATPRAPSDPAEGSPLGEEAVDLLEVDVVKARPPKPLSLSLGPALESPDETPRPGSE